ncbi:unnamed protein product [Brachionus calyciflorus]|uniref:AB hydrolase-1 domain-containing protein n=1 Tax=Brachionus calyciflorus TaxID=104777 RepID=A0A813UY78_9BILA|nr:unnamed protein product [Brachionus calyciflorus]
MEIFRKFFSSRIVTFVLNFVKYGALICIIPPLLNYAALNRESPVMGTHGLMYDVGSSQRLFLSCKGKGVPTIIMDSPIGLSSDIWLPLQEILSEVTKVCVYDRAGLGISERPFEIPENKSEKVSRAKIQRGQEFTLERMVEDLRRLVSSASHQDRPLMFVGSELGSMVARFYTQIYQDNVSHLVMINPLVETLFNEDNGAWKDFWYESMVPKWYSYAIGSVVGLNRFLIMANVLKPQIHTENLNDDILNRQKYLMSNPKHLFSLVDEFVNLNETLAQMKLIWSIKQFPQNVSVTVITGNKDDMFVSSDLFESSSNRLSSLRNTWKKSVDFLKNTLHPNANKIDLNDSVYKKLYNDPNYLFNILKDLVLKWRKNNVVAENI